MIINHYVDKIVGVVFFIAIVTMIGLYFFPESTLNTVSLAVSGIKPIVGIFGALLNIFIEVIKAILSVFS